jgi:hypothetical protein
MQLSYVCRLVFLVLCGAGLLQLLLEFIAWQMAPLFIRQTIAVSARRGERSLFLLALFARVSPWPVVLCAWLPAYMRGEDNVSGERVGFFCLIGAAGVLVWSLLCCLRVVWAWVGTWRFCNRCSAAGNSHYGLPVLLYPGERPLLALVGVFRSRIIVSQSLLNSKRFSAEFMDIALRHETAHARQHDNMKLLLLSLVPHFPLATRKQASLGQHWRLAAEMAADEDGVMGQPERCVQLAELLVTMARETNTLIPQGSFALLARPEDLGARVDRLLSQAVRSATHGDFSQAALQTGCTLVLGIGSLITLCYLCAHLGHRAAEVLLHIG